MALDRVVHRIAWGVRHGVDDKWYGLGRVLLETLSVAFLSLRVIPQPW